MNTNREARASYLIVAALLVLVMSGLARADYLSVDADGKHNKYCGAVVAISDDYPPTLDFVQGSAFLCGSGPEEAPRPGSIPFVLRWHGPKGDVTLKCTAPPPAFNVDGDVKFRAHFACPSQP